MQFVVEKQGKNDEPEGLVRDQNDKDGTYIFIYINNKYNMHEVQHLTLIKVISRLKQIRWLLNYQRILLVVIMVLKMLANHDG